ncbi:MAG TPA: hypothetical protein VI390_07755 [Methyloceanibacter sp.]
MNTKSTTATKKRYESFTNEEKAAMRNRVDELKVGHADPEAEALAKIAEMQPSDRIMAEKIHALVKSAMPALTPKTWYGMPAYAKDGKVVCFFQSSQKFKTRYATLGFSDQAQLDEGNMWPNAYALTSLTAAEETKIRTLIKRAAGQAG